MGENDRFKLSFTTTPAWDLQELIDVAHRYGYDGIDLEVEKDHKHGLELGATERALQQARETLQQEGLAVSAVATSLTFSDPDQAKRDAAVERGKQYVEFAQQLAAPHLEIFGGTLPAGIEPAAAIDYMAEALDDVVDHAAEAGVHVLLRTSGDFANTRYVREVCKQLYSEHFGVAWDVDQPLRILETLEEFNTIRGVGKARPPGVSAVSGEVFDLLRVEGLGEPGTEIHGRAHSVLLL